MRNPYKPQAAKVYLGPYGLIQIVLDNGNAVYVNTAFDCSGDLKRIKSAQLRKIFNYD